MELQYPKFRWFVLAVNVILILGQGMLLVAPSPWVFQLYSPSIMRRARKGNPQARPAEKSKPDREILAE
jgi:hypothetical protein